jgi:hypothetical protein
MIALGDLKVNDNVGLSYLTGINFAETRYDQRRFISKFSYLIQMVSIMTMQH